MEKTIYALVIMMFGGAEIGHAAGKCTATLLAETQRKVASVMKADNPKINDPWTKLRSAFDGKRDCLAIFEAYDFGEAIRHLIKGHWQTIGSLERYKKKDNSFFSFVISGLKDETANIEDIKAIHALAEKSCPSGSEPLCKEILESTERGQ